MSQPRKPMRIFMSILSNPPRYYASCSYKRRAGKLEGTELIVITGKKWDVTEDIEQIIEAALAKEEE